MTHDPVAAAGGAGTPDHRGDAPDGDAVETAPLARRLLAEAVGTATLVLLGCGAAFTTRGEPLATGLTFGLTLAVLVYAFGLVSGGHFNPAVSLGAAVGGRIPWSEAGRYVGAQFAGGLAGTLVLLILALGVDGYRAFDSDIPLAANGFSAGGYGYSWWAAFLAELVFTALFVLLVLGLTDRRNRAVAMLAPLSIGLTLAAVHVVLIPLTGASVNPARSLGPALVSGGDWLLQLWPFLIAPALGGVLAGLAYPALFGRDAEPVPGSGLSLSLNLGSGGSSSPAFTEQWNQGAAGTVQTPAVQHPQDSTVTQRLPEQPIIQDGWQWDPVAQQWIPAQQPPAGPGNGGWTDPGDERTQIRPQ